MTATNQQPELQELRRKIVEAYRLNDSQPLFPPGIDAIMQAVKDEIGAAIGKDYLTPMCLNYPEKGNTHCNNCFNCRVYNHGNDGSMTWDEGYEFKTTELRNHFGIGEDV